MFTHAVRRPLLTHATTTSITFLTTRGHKTAARTKRSLMLPPHPTMIPNTTVTATTIIYNPPSSAASPYHTPLKFLPKMDPRRANNWSALFGTEKNISKEDLPPLVDVAVRGEAPSYHLTREDAREIQKLRMEDPEKWSIRALAKKFSCSEVFITICTQAPREHKEKLEKRLDVIKSRWGPRKAQAREDRTRRKEMLFRGEL